MADNQPIRIDKEELKKKFDISNFDLNAVLRGMQLTLVGAHRALQNPGIFTNEHYRQAAIAVGVGIGIRLIVAIPIYGVKIALWFLSLIFSLEKATWDDQIVGGLNFIEEHVLQVPFFLMALMRYLTPTLDNLFMDSIRWVDQTYLQKHKDEDPTTLRPLFHPTLTLYTTSKTPGTSSVSSSKTKSSSSSSSSSSTTETITAFLTRSLKKAAISLAIYFLSFTPYVGRFVLPLVSLHTFHRAVGLGPAALLFFTGLLLPRRVLVIFLQTYFASRSLMRDLLEPYFARVRFDPRQKRAWFRARAGLLFGFALGFYALLRVPLVGVLAYGVAEAATAFLVTKITDPPPPPSQMDDGKNWVEGQLEWRNKQKFLSMSLFDVDAVHGQGQGQDGKGDEPPSYDEATTDRGRRM